MIQPPPLRINNTPDRFDGERVTYALGRWHAQDAVLQPHERQIEENVRMLVGQQWWFWNERLGQFVNVETLLSDHDKLWRQRPVLNRILYWFMHTHARLTENPAIIGFLPGPDQIDADLAEVMDVWYKTVWREADMTDAWDRLVGWMLPGGRAHFLSTIDWSRGALQQNVHDATLPMLDPASGQMIEQTIPNVPHDAKDQPLIQMGPNGPEPIVDPRTGQPVPAHSWHVGQITPLVLSPLECRKEWGPSPWHMARWHARVSFQTRESVEQDYQIKLEATQVGQRLTGASGSTGVLDRLLFGAGFYGAADRRLGTDGTQVQRDEFVRILEYWERPNQTTEGMEDGPGRPGGRYLCVCEDTKQVLADGPRPAAYPHTSPLSTFEFLRLPGRSGGTSLQEFINSPQRSINRLAGHEMEHAALRAHPIMLKAKGTGLEKITITNMPAQQIDFSPVPGVTPLSYVEPPSLSSDLLKTSQRLLDFMTDLGGTQSNPGEPPTRDSSGELVKELRFDRDRWIGPTQRRAVEEFGRMVETWMAMAPLLFPEERVLQYAGEDNVAQTIMVYPYLFEQGKVNVVPDAESMLPEGRGERQQRVSWMYAQGLFGPPGTPQAIAKFFELGRFPHLSRAAKPGGPDRVTADQNLGALLKGTRAAEIPVYPWYDLQIHLESLEGFLKRPEFKRQTREIQNELATYWNVLQQSLAATMLPAPPAAPDPSVGGRGAKPETDPSTKQLSLRPSGPRSAEEMPGQLQQAS